MAFHRKPVPQGPRPMKPSHTEASLVTPDARPKSGWVQGPNGEWMQPDGFSGDDLAPAVARMDVNERSLSISEDSQFHPTSPTQSHAAHRKIPRTSLDKPLPETPDNVASSEVDIRQIMAHGRSNRSSPEASKDCSREDTARELGMSGVLDLNDSEDTVYHRRQAPAVTHETITQPVHRVQHEVYERDVHEHEVYHRILPVQEVEVLPARHFVEDAYGQRHEVPADQVPGRSPRFTDRLLEEVFKLSLPEGGGSEKPRGFTARQFAGSEGDAWGHIDGRGTVHTERWWVHPPAVESTGLDDKDAYPIVKKGFAFEAEDSSASRPPPRHQHQTILLRRTAASQSPAEELRKDEATITTVDSSMCYWECGSSARIIEMVGVLVQQSTFEG